MPTFLAAFDAWRLFLKKHIIDVAAGYDDLSYDELTELHKLEQTMFAARDAMSEPNTKISTKWYERAHGCKPTEVGTWFFSIHDEPTPDWQTTKENVDWFQTNNMSYKDAALLAKHWASTNRYEKIYVQS